MADIAGIPYFEVQFNKAAAVHEEAAVAAVLGFLVAGVRPTSSSSHTAGTTTWTRPASSTEALFESIAAS